MPAEEKALVEHLDRLASMQGEEKALVDMIGVLVGELPDVTPSAIAALIEALKHQGVVNVAQLLALKGILSPEERALLLTLVRTVRGWNSEVEIQSKVSSQDDRECKELSVRRGRKLPLSAPMEALSSVDIFNTNPGAIAALAAKFKSQGVVTLEHMLQQRGVCLPEEQHNLFRALVAVVRSQTASPTRSLIAHLEGSCQLNQLQETKPALASSLRTVLADLKEMVTHQAEPNEVATVAASGECTEPVSFAKLSSHAQPSSDFNAGQFGQFTPAAEVKEGKPLAAGLQMQIVTEEDGASICADPVRKRAHEQNFVAKLASTLNVPIERIVVTGLEAGSLLTNYILLDAQDPNESTAEQLAVQLCEAIMQENGEALFPKAKAVKGVKETPAYHMFRFERLLSSAVLDPACLEAELDALGCLAKFRSCREEIPGCLAKLGNNDPRRKIHRDQLACLRLYTTNCIYKQCNKIMRELDMDQLRRYKHFLRFMIAGMYALPERSGQLFRRIHSERSYQVGEIISFPAWTSCSLGKVVFGGALEFRVSAQSREPTSHGRDIAWLSAVNSEAEVLVIPHTTFKVTKITPAKKSGEATIVELDENTARVVATPVLLWVDDVPSNNSNIVDLATKKGVRVVQKLSTRQALQFLDQNSGLLSRGPEWFRIISDMGRQEEAGSFVKDAGFNLLRELRKRNFLNYVLIYTSKSSSDKQAIIDSENLGPCIVCCESLRAQKFAMFE